MKSYRIAAYITGYQDQEAVKQCLSAIKTQTYPVDEIYIVDNSRESLIPSLPEDKTIIFDLHPENIGIAAGLDIAIKWAIGKNYDFLWTFDQDSEPLHDSLEKLLDVYQKLTDQNSLVGIIAPLSIDVDSDTELMGSVFDKYRFVGADNYYKPRDFYTKSTYDCDIVITSGSLVSLNAARNVDLPNCGLFIDAVDWDFCMKFRDKGYRVVVATDAVMKHNFGSFLAKRSASDFASVPIYSYSSLRYYYMCRNHTYIESNLAKSRGYYFSSVVYRFKSLIKKIAKIIVYDSDQKLVKIWACLRGTLDGFTGRLGKNW